MGVLWDLFGLAVFGADVRPNERSKTTFWETLLRIIRYSLALAVLIFIFGPMFARF